MLKKRLVKVQIILALGAILIAACGGNVPEATPTMSVEQIQTYAVATFASGLTLTAIAAPSNTPIPSPSPAVTIPPLATNAVTTPFGVGTTPSAPVGGVAATTSCYGLTFVSDVSIPDNTQMDPGETFTKTWQVQNSGSCAWDAGFKFQSTGGNAMGGTVFTLPATVASGATYNISVPMTAPSTAGTVRGNWRMSNASGQFFGDEVFVQIVVGSGGGAATAESSTSTPTPTATP